jgi:uncharacterized protein (TIGR02270 family)
VTAAQAITREIIPEIISQHAEESVFLRAIRDTVMKAPNSGLRDLARLDERIEAHLDGLRIGGSAARQILREAVEPKTESEVFVSTILEMELDGSDILARLFPLESISLEWWRGVASALLWVGSPQVERIFGGFAESSHPGIRLIALEGAGIDAARRRDCLSTAMRADAPWVRAEACEIAGNQRYRDLLGPVLACVDSPDERTRYAAVRAALLLGARSVDLPILNSLDSWGQTIRDEVARLAPLAPDQGREWVLCSRHVPELRRCGIIAAGALGEAWCVNTLLEDMRLLGYARVAGEAMSAMAGIDFTSSPSGIARPEDAKETPTDRPDEEDVEMDPDENLPWPDPNLIVKWWAQHKGEFQNGARYLLGKAISVDWCQEVLRTGRQRQRAAAALELAILQPGQSLFNVLAPGFRQQQMLGIKK